MRAFALAALLLAALPVAAQEELHVLGDGGAVPPERMLKAYLLSKAQEHFDARREVVAALRTPEEVAERQRRLRERFIEALGGFPEKTPLNPRVVGEERRDGYRIEKVIYESRPDHHVTATLYLPEGRPPFPGVLMPIGHSINGKAAEYVQRGSILLARNGLAVLAYDPIGQGERRQLLDADGQPVIEGSTTEHTMIGIGALLVGREAASYRVWDGIRGLDYLASRPEIDPERLGCTGCSGGGTLTSYLMALDDRIAVAAPSCYLTTLERLFATIGPQDAEQNITGQVAFGMDHADYVSMRAPRPTLLCAATRDFFDIQGTWTTFREAKRVYGVLGHGERVGIVEFDTPHGYPRPQREAVVRWMRRWLLEIDDAPVEGNLPIAEDASLACTKTGQVLSALKGRSVFDLNAERADDLERQRARRFAGRSAEELRAEIRKRLALPEQAAEVVVERKDPIRRGGDTIDRWAIMTEPGIQVPVLLFRPETPATGKPLVVYVGADRTLAAPGGPIERRLKAGEAVALVEPRGMGETAPATATSRRPSPFGVETQEAFLALHLGRPLLGQRVYDVLQALRALKQPAGFRLIGVGEGGLIALHTAVLDERVQAVEVEQSLVSWSAIARGTLSRDQLASVVPGVLAAYDLPDLAAALAPRPLTIRRPVDPVGEPVPRKELEQSYDAAREAYRQAGTQENFDLIAGK